MPGRQRIGAFSSEIRHLAPQLVWGIISAGNAPFI
jgi:hypothetical protein